MPQISVIIPVYKVEKYIHRCIDSILKQTFSDFELILVDDGSPDNCGAVCDEYAQMDDRIHVIHQENGGLSAARNAGIDWVFANSDSQWMTFIDSDDWVHPELLERLWKLNADHGTKISVCGYIETTGEEPALSSDYDFALWKPKSYYVEKNVNATVAWGKLYCRDCFQKARYPVGKVHEDEFTTYRLLFDQEMIAVTDMPLYFYFQNQEGITKAKWSPRRLDALEAYDAQIQYFRKRNDKDIVAFLVKRYFWSAISQLSLLQKANEDGRYDAYHRLIKRKINMLRQQCWKYMTWDEKKELIKHDLHNLSMLPFVWKAKLENKLRRK